MVIDNGNPTLSSSTRVVVTVDDVNDNAPEFLERFYKIQIPASVISHPESAVLQVLKFNSFRNVDFSGFGQKSPIPVDQNQTEWRDTREIDNNYEKKKTAIK